MDFLLVLNVTLLLSGITEAKLLLIQPQWHLANKAWFKTILSSNNA